MKNTNELKAKKAELKAAAEKLVNGAMESGHDLAGANLEQYQGHVTEIRNIESLLARHAELATMPVEGEILPNTVSVPASARNVNPRATAEYGADFFAYLRTGSVGAVLAALNITTPSQGGYGTPQDFDRTIVERLQNENVMRQISTVITTESTTNITVENNLGAASWTAEAAVAGNDDGSDDNSFSQIVINAFKATRIIKVSEELLQDAFFNLPGYLASKFAASFGILEESGFVAGNGTGRPTGVLTSASNSGITTASPTDIATDELIQVFHSLKRAYRSNARWLMNDSTALNVRLKKDSMGQYIWQPGLQAGQPDLLFGKPVAISDAMPAITATEKALLFGDFSYYTIADRSARTFTRLNELYAANGQVGFRAVERVDGKLTLAEAVKYLTMHA
jgi:HK97 family phage major capsid protein